jgi:DNA repair photolyase
MNHNRGPVHGRGAGSNLSGRFEKQTREGDPREALAEPELEPDPRTVFLTDHSRTAITTNNSPDIPFDRSINPYRGCEHGCVYCYARPTHEYLGYSAGLDFETKILVKKDLPALLRKELSAKGFQPGSINISGVTDCYQPAERKFAMTRGCLEVLHEFKNPFVIVTKNALVTRDLDLIAPMAAIQGAAVFVTITSLDPAITEVMEPRTSRPSARLEAIRKLTEAGVPVGVMVAPVVPSITDHEMPAILAAAREAGAKHAGFVPLRLPLAVAPLFEEWLGNHFPDRKEKVLGRIRDLRGGKLNDPNFKTRMRGQGEFASLLSQIFHQHCRRLGLNKEKLEIRADHFRKPQAQLGLFDGK